MADFNAMELMICVAARMMENGCSAVVGTLMESATVGKFAALTSECCSPAPVLLGVRPGAAAE